MISRLVKLLKEMRFSYKAFKYLIEQEKESKVNLRFSNKIKYLLKGFSSSKYGLYELNKNDSSLYLSDYSRRKTEKINGVYSLVINDKFIFSKVFENVTVPVFGRIKKGKIYMENKPSDIDNLLRLIIQKGKVIIKKYKGGGGKGIYKVSHKNQGFYIDDQLVKTEEVNKFISRLSDHLIMEHLRQLPYSNNIYPGTINSIRVLTMIDPESNHPFIAIAVHKFGSEKTKPADNVWKGGMTALIDLETGVLGKSALHQENNNKVEWISYHPDTKVEIEGTVIPNWNKVKQSILQIAQENDYLKYVGWDVVVTQEGVEIIEGNNYSDVNILQIHQPLLKDNRIRKFYKHHGII